MMSRVRPFQAQRVPAPPAQLYVDFLERAARYPVCDLEIGCGVGWHPLSYVRQEQNRLLVAIEHTRTRFAAFARRYAAHGKPDNLLPVHANAISWLTHAPEDARFARVFLLYPNPEMQNPAKRWIRMPFFAEILRRLAPGGSVHLCTNEKFYADEVIALAKPLWQLDLSYATRSRLNEPNFQPRTHFEKKYLERGDTLWDFHLR